MNVNSQTVDLFQGAVFAFIHLVGAHAIVVQLWCVLTAGLTVFVRSQEHKKLYRYDGIPFEKTLPVKQVLKALVLAGMAQAVALLDRGANSDFKMLAAGALAAGVVGVLFASNIHALGDWRAMKEKVRQYQTIAKKPKRLYYNQ